MTATFSNAPLVDSDVWIDYLRGVSQAVAFVADLPQQTVISAVSVAELYVGVREGRERKTLDNLLSTLVVVEVTQRVAINGGLLRRKFGPSHGVGLNDALIAATAMAHGLVLHTLNVKHFPMLEAAQLRLAYAK